MSRWLLAFTVLLAAVASALAVAAVSAAQISSQSTAMPLLERAVEALLEIDQYVAAAWPTLEVLAEQGQSIPLEDLPLDLQLDAAALANGPDIVADRIRTAAADLVYREGLTVLADLPQDYGVLSQSALFDAAIDRLTTDSRGLAVALLAVSGVVALLLAAAAAAQVRGLWRVSAAAGALGLGAGAVWLVATITRSNCIDRASALFDPFEAEMWLIGADALSLVARNGGIIAVACIVVMVAAASGGLLLRVLDGDRAADRDAF